MSIQEKRKYMLSMIAYWLKSGKSKKAYCAENRINEVKFYYWISRIKESDKSAVGFLTIGKASKNSDIEYYIVLAFAFFNKSINQYKNTQ